jgi:predicted DNA-binding transcriptional regulator AlpA
MRIKDKKEQLRDRFLDVDKSINYLGERRSNLYRKLNSTILWGLFPYPVIIKTRMGLHTQMESYGEAISHLREYRTYLSNII